MALKIIIALPRMKLGTCMKQLNQLGATAKGLPLQFITEQWGNPLWLPHLYGCPNYFMHVP